MEINEHILNNLLKPLSFHVVFVLYYPDISYYKWNMLDSQDRLVFSSNYNYDDNGDRVIHDFDECIYEPLSHEDIKSIWKQVIEHECFVVDSNVHSNPYFKCSSLEEAFIRKDLLDMK